jgi:hypothetical protein
MRTLHFTWAALAFGAGAIFVACGDSGSDKGNNSAGGTGGTSGGSTSVGGTAGSGASSAGGSSGGSAAAGNGGTAQGGTTSSGGADESGGMAGMAGSSNGSGGGNNACAELDGTQCFDPGSGGAGSGGAGTGGDSAGGAGGGGGDGPTEPPPNPAIGTSCVDTSMICVCGADGDWRCLETDPDCPDEEPTIDTDCEIAELTAQCGYDDGIVCRCRAAVDDTWGCTGPDGSTNAPAPTCPSTVPDDAADCSGSPATNMAACTYPDTTCVCDPDSEEWFCFSTE